MGIKVGHAVVISAQPSPGTTAFPVPAVPIPKGQWAGPLQPPGLYKGFELPGGG